MTSAAEGAFLAFFLVQNQDFSGKITIFGAFWTFTDVRFGPFSVLTDVSFEENEISIDAIFRLFLGGSRTGGKTHSQGFPLAPAGFA